MPDSRSSARVMGDRDGYYDLDPPAGMNPAAVPEYEAGVAEGKARRAADLAAGKDLPEWLR